MNIKKNKILKLKTIPPPKKNFIEWLGDRGEGAFSNHGVILEKGGKK